MQVPEWLNFSLKELLTQKGKPDIFIKNYLYSPVAQSVERVAVNHHVSSSSLFGGA